MLRNKIIHSLEFGTLYVLIGELLFRPRYNVFQSEIDIYSVLNVLIEIFLMASIYLLYISGQIRKNKKFKIIVLVVFILIAVGTIFKIVHLPGAQFLRFFGYLSLGISYLVIFLFRKPKLPLDYLKVLWVVLYVLEVTDLFT